MPGLGSGMRLPAKSRNLWRIVQVPLQSWCEIWKYVCARSYRNGGCSTIVGTLARTYEDRSLRFRMVSSFTCLLLPRTKRKPQNKETPHVLKEKLPNLCLLAGFFVESQMHLEAPHRTVKISQSAPSKPLDSARAPWTTVVFDSRLEAPGVRASVFPGPSI